MYINSEISLPTDFGKTFIYITNYEIFLYLHLPANSIKQKETS